MVLSDGCSQSEGLGFPRDGVKPITPCHLDYCSAKKRLFLPQASKKCWNLEPKICDVPALPGCNPPWPGPPSLGAEHLSSPRTPRLTSLLVCSTQIFQLRLAKLWVCNRVRGDVGGLAVLTLKAWPGQPCWFIFKWHFVSSEKRGDISDVRHAGRGTAVPLRHKPLFVLLSIRPPVTSCRCCDVPARTG